ncbi:isochorismate synthase [Corynebacterium terpenotabidum]|uniref:isochorismate synthase n=1 Tax=Corynebacterium terpenotabidum Y-11 TaxID=1200352 RepID=S4XDN9_9CORY|nr:isochorismate synthase [Corynebacterium terpenotabidum]AGP31267.1 Isochorismate synthase [Corynebacterium terpenotabidum Y-11]
MPDTTPTTVTRPESAPVLPPLTAASRGDFTFRRGVTGVRVPADRLSPVDGWAPGRTVVGALPFDHRDGSTDRLYTTDLPLTLGSLTAGAAHDLTGDGVHTAMVDTGAEETYTGAVRAALDAMGEDGALNKVVLGRSVRATLDRVPDWESLLRRLSARNRNAWVFSVPLGTADSDRAFLGASPELLLSRRGDRIISHPLAGSVPRSSDPEEDRRRAERLTGSAKDHYEHAFVVDMIAETLGPWCAELDIPAQPELLATDKMWHLGTRITGRLKDAGAAGTDALSLARLLHPTPAVAGVPTRPAMDRIRDLEPVDRRYFAGTAGWCDADGDGDWVVSIRSAEFDGDRVTAWAGAGIVDGSDPDSEYTETGAKLRTVLEGLGIVPAIPDAMPHYPHQSRERVRGH